MKRFILILIAIVCAISPCLAAFDGVDEYFIICKPGTCVNVRISPNTHSEVIGSKFFGDVIYVDREEIRERQGHQVAEERIGGDGVCGKR